MKSNYNFNLYSQNRSSENIEKITTAVYNLGTLKGIGSSTRIYNNCLNTTNDNVTECMSLFTGAEANPTPPTTGLLFNTNTFYNKFDYSRTGRNSTTPPILLPANYNQMPQKYINALLEAVSRWNKFLEFKPDMVELIRTLGYPTWTGIELYNFQLKNFPNVSWTANAGPIPYKKTTINPQCLIQINTKYSDALSESDLAVILTHELGHVLGFPCQPSLVNGTGAQLLPNQVILSNTYLFGTYPAYTGNYFKKLIKVYNEEYKAYVYTGSNPPPGPNNYIVGYPNNYPSNLNLTHWASQTILAVNYDTNPNRFYYRGFKNELMISNYNNIQLNKLYISKMTIAALMAQYSSINGKNYFNYLEKNPGSSEVTSIKNPDIDDPIEFAGSY